MGNSLALGSMKVAGAVLVAIVTQLVLLCYVCIDPIVPQG
jgi:hypothetical protein